MMKISKIKNTQLNALPLNNKLISKAPALFGISFAVAVKVMIANG